MTYYACMLDPQGMIRAWGKSDSRTDAIAIAMLELDAYRDEKRKLGDPLGDADYRLKVKTIRTKK